MRGALATAVLLLGLLASSSAEAYPELVLENDARRCNSCHVSPSGGGLLNGYGRSASEDVSASGGDGAFLHGLWTPPSWLTLGGDVRGAALVNDVGADTGPQVAVFPMQLDLRARVRSGSFSLVATGGLRGSARRYERAETSDYLVSPEHYLMWQPRTTGPFARIGRFFPTQGLRLPDHTLYVRRYTGSNLFEEPYALGLGYLQDDWEVQASAFVHDPVLDVGRDETGATLHGEVHGSDRWALGLSMRVGTAAEASRVLAGLSGRWRALPSVGLTLLGEVDAIREQVDTPDGDIGRDQLVSYLGADLTPARGWRVGASWEHYHEAIGVPGLARDAFGASLRWFPIAHVEVIVVGRWQLIGSDEQARLAMLQLHYYL